MGNEKKKAVFKAGLGILTALIICGVLFTVLLLWDECSPLCDSVEPSNALAGKLLASAIKGEDCEVGQAEINPFLAARFEGEEHTGLKGVYLSIHESDATAYLSVGWNGIPLGVQADFTLACRDGKILIDVNAARIGKLPVNPAWVLGLVHNALPDRMILEGNRLSMNAAVLEGEYLGQYVDLQVATLEIHAGSLIFGTKTELTMDLKILQEKLAGILS